VSGFSIRCGRLFDGTDRDVVDDAVLTIRNGRIVSCDATGKAIANTDMIDLGRYFVMPGLIDGHTHLSIVPGRGDQIAQLRQSPGEQALRVVPNLERDLRTGTTTMRIMGEEDWLDVNTRRAIERGDLVGPNLLIATRVLTASNGFAYAKVAFDGVDAIRRGARENLARGADFLKLVATGGASGGSDMMHAEYSYAEIATAVEEAQRAGTYVAAHAHGGIGLREAVRAGVRTIEHAALASDEEIDLMVEHSCWVILTSGILFHSEGLERSDAASGAARQRLEEVRARASDRIRQIIKSGVNLALGTDSLHGELAFEVEMAIDFGLSPKDALRAVTARAAEAVGVADEVGTLESGKRADVIAVDGDPLHDPDTLRRVVFVMLNGRPIVVPEPDPGTVSRGATDWEKGGVGAIVS
jgi:imidazolonepropionase-like amidohydrolase